MDMKRVVVFLPRAVIRTCDALAARYASNRSEVIRLGLGEGMPTLRAALARLQRVRLVELEAAEERRALKGGRVRPSFGAVPLDADTAVSELVAYGRSARRVQKDLDEPSLRVALLAHAQVSGVSLDDVDDVVGQALATIFEHGETAPASDSMLPPE